MQKFFHSLTILRTILRGFVFSSACTIIVIHEMKNKTKNDKKKNNKEMAKTKNYNKKKTRNKFRV